MDKVFAERARTLDPGHVPPRVRLGRVHQLDAVASHALTLAAKVLALLVPGPTGWSCPTSTAPIEDHLGAADSAEHGSPGSRA